MPGSGGLFPPLGAACWIVGAGAVVAGWRHPGARWWLLVRLVMMVCEGIASAVYFWPRNDIMFNEGLAQHSTDYLITVAREFETWHWRSRMLFNSIAAIGAFAAFLPASDPGPTRSPAAASTSPKPIAAQLRVRTHRGHLGARRHPIG